MTVKEVQLGKQGITKEFIADLDKRFENSNNIKISVLSSCCRDRDELKEMKNEIIEKLDGNYRGKIIGFKIILKKQSKKQ